MWWRDSRVRPVSGADGSVLFHDAAMEGSYCLQISSIPWTDEAHQFVSDIDRLSGFLPDSLRHHYCQIKMAQRKQQRHV